VFEALIECITLEGGRVTVCDADSCHAFWLIHLHPFFTLMAAAAGRLLNAHVTSCSSLAQLVTLWQHCQQDKELFGLKAGQGAVLYP